MAGLLAISVVASAITGGLAGIGQLDKLVMTHQEVQELMHPNVGRLVELEKSLAVLDESVAEIRVWNRCARLEERLDNLDDRKWRIENVRDDDDDVDIDELRDVTRDKSKTQRQFDALQCAEVLAG